MRIGTTSYIYPADIMTNLRRLAGKYQDIELLLFEYSDAGRDLPTEAEISEMSRLASENDMTYTVHLPLDLHLSDSSPNISNTLDVIRRMEPLNPHGFILHLDGKEVPETEPDRWLKNSTISLEKIVSRLKSPELVCIENLENHNPDYFSKILSEFPVSCCIDVGHLWKCRIDPLPYMNEWLHCARVVHLHGVSHRDHKSLSFISREKLMPVIDLLHKRFDGVLTFEVFNEPDLHDSIQTFRETSTMLCSTVN